MNPTAPIDIAAPLADLRTQGFCIIKDAIEPDHLAALREALTQVLSREYGPAGERGYRTDTYHVSYLLAGKHELFLHLPHQPVMAALAAAQLGSSWRVSSLNGFTTTPMGREQLLHTDHPDGTPGMTINAMVALDDFTVENGATRVCPGSHRANLPVDAIQSEEDRLRWGNQMIERCGVTQLVAPAGSLIAFDGALWHGSGRNQNGSPRRSLHLFYTRHWVRPQWDHARSLPPDTIAAMDEDLQRRYDVYRPMKWYDLTTQLIMPSANPNA